MKLGLWQRLRRRGEALVSSGMRGTTIVREERGSGAGAVLFQPYAVSEFIPDTAGEDDLAGPERLPARAVAGAVMPDLAPAAVAPRVANPVGDAWRRANPDMFRTIARRFCARAPEVTHELHEHCLSGQHVRLARLAASLKPSLGLYDMTAADVADRVERLAAAPAAADLTREVLALEDEVRRVANAWQDVDGWTATVQMEVTS